MEIINKIKDLLLSNNNSIQLLSLLVTVVIAFFTAYVTSNIEKRKSTTNYFKQQGIEKQKHILTFWHKILNNDYDEIIKEYKLKYKLKEKVEDKELLSLVLEDNFIYSSKKSIRAIADYMQYTFRSKNYKGIVTLVLVARIISLLKYDFTGENPKVMDILRLRINDLDIIKIIKINIILFYYKFRKIVIFLIFMVTLFLIS